MNQDKLYICVLDTVPDNIVPTLVSHAVLRHHLYSQEYNDKFRYNEWIKDSFRKCVVRLNIEEFNKVLALENVTITEESTIGNHPACLTILAKQNEHNVLKFSKLWNVT